MKPTIQQVKAALEAERDSLKTELKRLRAINAHLRAVVKLMKEGLETKKQN